MKRKKTLYSLVMVFAVFVLASASTLAASKPAIIKLAHVAPPDPWKSPFQAACLGFKNAVEELSEGRFEVKIYPGGTLGRELDLMEAVKANQIQAHLATPGGLSRIFPPAYLYSTPFMFKNVAIAMTVLDGPFTDKIVKAFTAKTGIEALGFIDMGTYGCFTNNVRPLKTQADFKGIKFRAMDQLQITMFKSLGASAVPIAWPELYTSLQTGVIQGQINPAFLINMAKFYEVQKYLTPAPMTYSPLLFVANKGWYDSLSPKDQHIMKVATLYGKAIARGLGMFLEITAMEKLKQKGMEVTVFSKKEIQEIGSIVRPKCLEMLKSRMDPKWVEGLIGATKEAEAQLNY